MWPAYASGGGMAWDIIINSNAKRRKCTSNIETKEMNIFLYYTYLVFIFDICGAFVYCVVQYVHHSAFMYRIK